jgi:hypothetical protein
MKDGGCPTMGKKGVLVLERISINLTRVSGN